MPLRTWRPVIPKCSARGPESGHQGSWSKPTPRLSSSILVRRRQKNKETNTPLFAIRSFYLSRGVGSVTCARTTNGALREAEPRNALIGQDATYREIDTGHVVGQPDEGKIFFLHFLLSESPETLACVYSLREI